jgi:flagellar biosynthesis/type III secretory pathway protein FliH
MGRKKRETYYERWRKEHPQVTFYLTKDEYETIKELAFSKNMTIKDFIVGVAKNTINFKNEIKSAFDKGFQEGYSKGHDKGYKEGYAQGHQEGYDKGFKEGKVEGMKNVFQVHALDIKTTAEKLLSLLPPDLQQVVMQYWRPYLASLYV